MPINQKPESLMNDNMPGPRSFIRDLLYTYHMPKNGQYARQGHMFYHFTFIIALAVFKMRLLFLFLR